MQFKNTKIARKLVNVFNIFVLLFFLVFGSLWTLVTTSILFVDLMKGNEINSGVVVLLAATSIGPIMVIGSQIGRAHV